MISLEDRKKVIDSQIPLLEAVEKRYSSYGADTKFRGYGSLRNALREMRAESKNLGSEIDDIRYLTGEKTLDAEQVLIGRTNAQIHARNIRVPFDFTWEDNQVKVTVMERQINPNMWLVHYAWKARNRNVWGDTQKATRDKHASFLCGTEDGQDWAVRVPGTLYTIKDALHWITPGPVRQAIKKGKTVYRQGDMYFIPLQISGPDLDALYGSGHTAARGTDGITVTHGQHPDLLLPNLRNRYSWRAVSQMQMGNSNSRTGAD